MVKQITLPVRKSSGAVVYRNNALTGVLQVLLVRSSSGKNWCFPKGGIEPDLSSRLNAIKETWEEAGIIGELGAEVSTYRYTKQGVRQKVRMYALEAAVELTVYPEAKIRERRWFMVSEAAAVLDTQLQDVLSDFLDVVVEA